MTPAANSQRDVRYEAIRSAGPLSNADSRWIGRCKRCQRAHRIDGRVMLASLVGGRQGSDFVIVGSNGLVFMTNDLGTNPHSVTIRCGDHWCRLERVHEGKKQSKHECGARCTNATGPSCDCRCKGKTTAPALEWSDEAARANAPQSIRHA